MATSTFLGLDLPDGSDALEPTVRLGYVARALLYAVIALTSLSVALGFGGRPEDSRGALATVARQPLGTVLVAIIALGLAGYALWRAWQALTLDTEDMSLPEQLFQRGYYGGRAVLYGLLTVSAVQILLPGGKSGQGSGNGTLLAKVLGWPGGRYLAVAVGLGIIAYAGFQAHRAITAKFLEDLDRSQMSESQEHAVMVVGRAGYTARFVVFGLVGVFVTFAAWTSDPEKARGFDGALGELVRQPYGPWLLGVVALGLFGFSVFSAAQARFRSVEVDA